MNNNKIQFKCLKVKQPIGEFYIGTIGYKDLIDISYADVRRLEKREREIETYIGIQRPLSANRVKQINKYVNLIDATFPTGVILSVSSDDVDYNSDGGIMTLERDSNTAKVLDGQHRIAGLEKCEYKNEEFQINIVLFVDMELEDQAIVFATINKAQTKVNKSLVVDLYDFEKSRSPQKTAHNIVRALNESPKSPFYGKIKILGTAEDKEKETITQATFVDSILKYMTSDMMTDRDLYKRGMIPELIEGRKLKDKFFRNLFIENQDDKIMQIVKNYFSAVKMKWPQAWNEVRINNILNKSTGFIALMRFLKDIYLHLAKDDIGVVVTEQDFFDVFKRIDLKENDFNREKYVPGGLGQTDLYKDLLEQSNIKHIK